MNFTDFYTYKQEIDKVQSSVVINVKYNGINIPELPWVQLSLSSQHKCLFLYPISRY